MNSCLTCSHLTNNPKFCSRSCSASYNNKGKRRHGQAPESRACAQCNTVFVVAGSNSKKYCNNKCQAAHDFQKYFTEEEKMNAERMNNRKATSRYRIKHTFKIDPTANTEIINRIYENTPLGFEVDHIVPLSRGGKHHESNLRYLLAMDNRKKNNKLDEEYNQPMTVISWEEVFEAIECGYIENGEEYV